MKPVVMYAKTQLEVAMAMWRIRRAARDAIESTGAVRITVEPAPPAANEVPADPPPRRAPGLLAVARVAR